MIEMGLNGFDFIEKIVLFPPDVKVPERLFDRQMHPGDELHTLFALCGELHL